MTATSTSAPVFGSDVPQPVQYGSPGGVMRRLNLVTAVLLGVGCASLTGFVVNAIVPSTASTATFAPVAPDLVYLGILVGWVIGFMAGIGAFVAPIRWFRGCQSVESQDAVLAEFSGGRQLGQDLLDYFQLCQWRSPETARRPPGPGSRWQRTLRPRRGTSSARPSTGNAPSAPFVEWSGGSQRSSGP